MLQLAYINYLYQIFNFIYLYNQTATSFISTRNKLQQKKMYSLDFCINISDSNYIIQYKLYFLLYKLKLYSFENVI